LIFGFLARGKRRRVSPHTEVKKLPEGALLIPIGIKEDYEAVPLHVYYPTPFDKVTILKHKRQPHLWLCLGWYLGLQTEQENVMGQIYKPVVNEQDRQAIMAQVRAQDREANIQFAVS